MLLLRRRQGGACADHGDHKGDEEEQQKEDSEEEDAAVIDRGDLLLMDSFLRDTAAAQRVASRILQEQREPCWGASTKKEKAKKERLESKKVLKVEKSEF